MNETSIIRIPSGIWGLDEMIEGGFPFPSVILVAGSAGTGKTTFAQKYLFEGAKHGEQGLFITTLSEPTQWMLRYSARFGFIKREYFGREIIYVDMGSMLRNAKGEDIISFIDDKIAEVMPQRIVIDPVTIMQNMLKEEDYRMFLFDLTNHLKNWEATTLLTGEVGPGELYPSDISYAVDGVILLMMKEEDSARRKYIEVLKMRGTNHQTGMQPINIDSENGIMVLKSSF